MNRGCFQWFDIHLEDSIVHLVVSQDCNRYKRKPGKAKSSECSIIGHTNSGVNKYCTGETKQRNWRRKVVTKLEHVWDICLFEFLDTSEQERDFGFIVARSTKT